MVRVDVTGRDRLDAEVLGEIAEEAEAARVASLERPLQLDEEAIPTEDTSQSRGGVRVEQPEPASRTTGKADEPFVQLGDGVEGHRGRKRIAVLVSRTPRSRVRVREQPAEVRVPASRLHQQRDVRAAVERDLRARDRPNAERLGRMRELEGAVDAVVVRECDRLVSELGRAGRELLRLRRPVEERVRRMAVQLDVRH